jgi:hypothetical protein
MKTFSLHGVVLLVIFVLLSASGCISANKNFGKFVPDDQARIAFETFQINPEFRYYITGSDLYPVAILALNKSYVIGNDLWKELDLTPQSMNDMVTHMQRKLMERCHQNPHGFVVYDHQGKAIGTLYSYLGVGIAFRMDSENVVRIYGPRDDDQLKSYQERVQK